MVVMFEPFGQKERRLLVMVNFMVKAVQNYEKDGIVHTAPQTPTRK